MFEIICNRDEYCCIAVIQLYVYIYIRNTKVKVRSPDGDTEYFDIVAGVLQGDTLAPYLLGVSSRYNG